MISQVWRFSAPWGQMRNPFGKNGVKVFGRFHAARRIYSRTQRLKRSADMRFHPINAEAGDLVISASPDTYFHGLSIEDSLRDLRLDGVSQAFHLPEPVVDGILSYAQEARFRTDGCSEKKRIADFRTQRDMGTLSVTRVICPDIAGSKEVMSILRDHSIHQVAAGYLGYRPRICEAYLEVLFRTEPGAYEPSYRPYEYHYDIPGFGFIGFFFYLNDVDESNGAHVMIRQSHNRKPLGLLLRSGQSAGKLAPMHYGRDLELTLTGPKGHGFAEDLYSFHKVLRPTRGDRMSLQIRYY